MNRKIFWKMGTCQPSLVSKQRVLQNSKPRLEFSQTAIDEEALHAFNVFREYSRFLCSKEPSSMLNFSFTGGGEWVWANNFWEHEFLSLMITVIRVKFKI